MLVKRENPNLSVSEKEQLREDIMGLLERWWRTGEIYLEKPRLEDERSNSFSTILEMYFLLP